MSVGALGILPGKAADCRLSARTIAALSHINCDISLSIITCLGEEKNRGDWLHNFIYVL